MHRRFALAVAFLAFHPATVLADAAHPHVIVFLADDAGAGDFSFTGNTNLSTPVIDGMARDGARLDRFFLEGR